MGFCQLCKAKSIGFCFVHKHNICDACLASSQEHALCVCKTYYAWIVDGFYDFPVRCTLCNHSLSDSDATIRLGCRCIFHQHCLNEEMHKSRVSKVPAAEWKCAECSVAVLGAKPGSDKHSPLQAAADAFVADVLNGTVLDPPVNAAFLSSSPAPLAVNRGDLKQQTSLQKMAQLDSLQEGRSHQRRAFTDLEAGPAPRKDTSPLKKKTKKKKQALGESSKKHDDGDDQSTINVDKSRVARGSSRTFRVLLGLVLVLVSLAFLSYVVPDLFTPAPAVQEP